MVVVIRGSIVLDGVLMAADSLSSERPLDFADCEWCSACGTFLWIMVLCGIVFGCFLFFGFRIGVFRAWLVFVDSFCRFC